MELTVRQKDILKAAIAIIANQGYEKLTIKNLATKIGVTEAALYRHFKSKREIVTMILSYFEELSNRVLNEICESNNAPLDNIRKFVEDRYILFSKNPDLAKVMFSEELFKNDPTFKGQFQCIMHKHKQAMESYLIQAQKDGNIKKDISSIQLFRIIIGSMRFTVTQWNLSDGAFDLQKEGSDLFESIIKLIRIKEEDR
ncbi:MAG TPA: TetR/AcrR family transcriptional regulator [Candidatus Cloacimonas sp.]|jgi:AcrR family transcriptional regulator|nr:TetR/AcrR family transcriptional regulator [Candidatus Cloacimonas sp.]MDD2250998.1 TetR/AcrR family transcriptional regulator [Candidatus Cloacimonadota bacterium]MCK9165188.1 TetR/AcrR family transcriptional regulator [Candidatus Cloacimonas sp.]MDD3734437.1 TetR/AcrR family transcriptional regulator [Candidatus Cloacimonadota bacterium]MDD4677104.1 TetR/AcrR family transcriptional regulator [Candidatus Cloacimonadota bacterium]